MPSNGSPSNEPLDRELAALREQLGSVLESSSWRLTRSLRRLRRSTRPEALPPAAAIVADPAGVDPSLPAASVPVCYPPGHYYSPLPDPDELLAAPRRSQVWPPSPRPTPGLDWRESQQVALCHEVFARQARLDFSVEASDDPSEYFVRNGQYPPLDAWLLEAMLQLQRPRRLIEVGSGFSSLVAARVNRELLGGSMHFTCIEPYPRQFLLDGVPGVSDLILAKIQDVPLETFETLGDGDIFFVDTSHTVKTGGDVTWIFQEIIPRLAPGVLVHVHDIFAPADYPEPWVREGRGWNETYLVRAFLAFNADFEIVLGIQHLAQANPEAVRAAFPGWASAADTGGAALWFRRRLASS